MKKYPDWFNYKVNSFACDTVEEINEQLVTRDVEANDVINIIHDFDHEYWYEVFYRERL